MKKYLATYGKPRFLGIVPLSDETYEEIKTKRLFVALSRRGEEIAEVVGPLNDEQEGAYRSLRTISEHGEGPVRGGDPVVTDLEFVRAPEEKDLLAHQEHIEQERENLSIAQELVEWHQLPIKLIDAECLLDEKKLFFYFTSEQRVDFRTLVKDLARRFKTRIELRQMGVRDEARIIRGVSSCGLPCCCSYWLNQFAPIGIKMVKEQNIALNPAKISGICGRLMCCMAFEHKVYRELWNGLPGPGSKIKTPNGNYVVLSMDVAREAVRCHKPGGGDIVVPRKLFAEFRQAVMEGEDWEVPEDVLEEMNARRKKCESCQSGFASRSFEHVDIAKEKTEASPRERGGATLPDGGDPGAKKRTGRRRGRRGGRKQGAEGTAAGTASQDAPRRSESNRAAPRNDGVTRNSNASAGVQARAEDGEKAKRPRRRRRRPKRPGAEGGNTAPQE